MYVNGRARPVGYLSSLRILQQYRGGAILARGYAFLRQLLAREVERRLRDAESERRDRGTRHVEGLHHVPEAARALLGDLLVAPEQLIAGDAAVAEDHGRGVVGTDDADMAAATNRLGEIEGGFVVVKDETVLAEVALPVAGLMSLKTHEEVRAELEALRAAARLLGVTLDEPFLQLAFLALPVIPHLKITDHGLVDVDRFEVIA